MYDVRSKTVPKNLDKLRKSVQKIIIIRDYQQRNVSLSNSPELQNEKVFYWNWCVCLEFYSTFC